MPVNESVNENASDIHLIDCHSATEDDTISRIAYFLSLTR